MKKLLLAGVALACLPLCACIPPAATGAPGQTPTGLEQFETAAGMSYAAYCTLPEITRQAIRDRLTKGLPVVVCPGDLIPIADPSQVPKL